MQEVTLDGMPPIKKPRIRVVKKHLTTKNVPVEVSIRRQVSAELGDDEPSKDEKFILLQKYGVTAPRIDRLVTKPNWMGVAEWKRKQNDWFKVTKGMVSPQQRPRSNYRPMPNSQQRQSISTQQNTQLQSRPLPKRWNPQQKFQRSTKVFLPNFVPTQTAIPHS